MRSYIIWKLLLGVGFAWWDFPHYVLGSLMGWYWAYSVGKISRKKETVN